MTCELKINGQQKSFPEGGIPKTLSELLDQMEINKATVVAEIDGVIIEKDKFDETNLYAGQNIELIRFVGGG